MSIIAQMSQEIQRLKAENHKLKLTMQLHAGDCCSLNNEVELFRGHWMDAEQDCELAEKRCEELEERLAKQERENRRLKDENQTNKL